jgi:hypothetical protein
MIFGFAPAQRATHLDLNHALRGASRSIFDGARRAGRLPIGKLLVPVQVAISLVLIGYHGAVRSQPSEPDENEAGL